MKNKIQIKRYGYDTRETEVVADVYVRDIARALDPESFATLLGDMVNGGFARSGNPRSALAAGRAMRSEHRHLQACAVKFLCGFIVGLSEQEYTDPRNKHAIAFAKELANVIEGTFYDPLYINGG